MKYKIKTFDIFEYNFKSKSDLSTKVRPAVFLVEKNKTTALVIPLSSSPSKYNLNSKDVIQRSDNTFIKVSEFQRVNIGDYNNRVMRKSDKVKPLTKIEKNQIISILESKGQANTITFTTRMNNQHNEFNNSLEQNEILKFNENVDFDMQERTLTCKVLAIDTSQNSNHAVLLVLDSRIKNKPDKLNNTIIVRELNELKNSIDQYELNVNNISKNNNITIDM